MKWKGRRQSDNVDDRRGMGSKGKVIAGGGLIGIVILLLNAFGGETGQMIAPVLEQLNQGQQQEQTTSRELTSAEIEMGGFVKTVFADTEDIWGTLFRENNLGVYKQPQMVLFSDTVNTQCGGATAASGPFYCPVDQTVYIDLSFFEELRTRFGAKGGDFAIAYVIAHEVGHHVQTLLETSQKVRQAQQGITQTAANKYSVALELQADFYAGLWAHYNQDYLEAGDIEEALSAAHAVGDDAIQSKMQGHVNQETFTHGSSAQRVKWFKRGYQSGDLSLHDTFREEL